MDALNIAYALNAGVADPANNAAAGAAAFLAVAVADADPALEGGFNFGDLVPHQANNADLAEDPAIGTDADGFTLVASSKFGKQRGAFRQEEDEIPTKPESVIELEYEWYPKPGSVRSMKKWARVRKGGMIGTREGVAVLVYPILEV